MSFINSLNLVHVIYIIYIQVLFAYAILCITILILSFRPVMFIQPSTTDEIFTRNSVHYIVHGRDKDMFEMRQGATDRPDQGLFTGEIPGSWTLHFKQKISRTNLA